MALRVLTQEEKASLAANATFIEKCKQGVRDYAVYWSVHDGSGLSTEADRIMWAKNRLIGVEYVKNPIINLDGATLAWFFLNGAKGKQYDLNAAPETDAVLIAAWDAQSSFDEFAAYYFGIKGNELDFTATNN